MKIKILTKNITSTASIKEYVLKRATNLGKLLDKFESKGGEVLVHFEVGKSTMHHKTGEFLHADAEVHIDGQKFYASADKEDLYDAVDTVKDSLFRKINKSKGRKQTLKTRGARSVKKMMKGLSTRDPQTATYKKPKTKE